MPMSSKPKKGAKQRHQTRWSSQKRSTLHRPYHQQKAHRVSARRIYAPDQKQSSRGAYQRQRRKNKVAALMSSKPQRKSCQHHQSRRNSRMRSIPQRPRQRQKMHRVSARTMYAPGQNRNGHRAHRHPHRRSRPVAPMPSEQRNPAQKKRLRGIIFIQSSRKSSLQTIYLQQSEKSRMHCKSAIRCNPKPCQQNRPLFIM